MPWVVKTELVYAEPVEVIPKTCPNCKLSTKGKVVLFWRHFGYLPPLDWITLCTKCAERFEFELALDEMKEVERLKQPGVTLVKAKWDKCLGRW